ncbi:MAG: aminoacetone oxidase family FAD-binding enzyme [Bacteroidales bacterium]|nr:aminoacetone oxidase family FAD-binding enzyme [Bacteroidales bacterium]
MKSDIIIIGGGAAGLMAAYGAGKTLAENGKVATVTVLEKMPRVGRKIMITGKGRCNFTNLKSWNEFSGHIRSKANALKPALYNLTSQGMIDFLNDHGLETVVERGDRAFPASYHASDVVDTLLGAAKRFGAKVVTDCEVSAVSLVGGEFVVETSAGQWTAGKLIIATGGLSYPGTGSTGDGYRWARSFGDEVTGTFPSLTAMVPKGYKSYDPKAPQDMKGHIDRSEPLSEIGKALAGVQLKNINLSLYVGQNEVQTEFGDIDFTDGGIEGPVGFGVSRNCVKAIVNGGKASLVVDMKPGVEEADLLVRIKALWNEIQKDPRSRRLNVKEMMRVLLGKLMPWDLIPGFTRCNPEILQGKKGNERIDFGLLASVIKAWKFEIEGYVGYERCVVTAGGVSTDCITPKTLESRKTPGLYYCGEVLDADCDTGGYNLQVAFSTGLLAGESAAKAL